MVRSDQTEAQAANGTTTTTSDGRIDDEYEKKLGAKLAVIEELRCGLSVEGVKCPGVLVIGAQSAGKSSVLERLTGIAFPRAENTCTRVPTIVQLQINTSLHQPKALVSTDPDFKNSRECLSMQEIQDAIHYFTQQLVTNQIPVSDNPIHIQYIRRQGPVMTLIDLPGITHNYSRNPDFNIHGATASMVHKYVNNENMIILVVIPANEDFGNSEALEISRNYDGEGTRTIGVISKCDLVPDISDIVEKIRMTRASDTKVALGFIAVRNKGPQEEHIDIEAAEKELFKNHKVLRHLQDDERGFDTLCQKVVDLQGAKVSRFIPEVKQMVRKKISEINEELGKMTKVPRTSGERRAILSRELCDIDEKVSRLIRAEDTSERELNISARSDELAAGYAESICEDVPDWLGEEMGKNLKELIKEKKGYSLPNFISDSVFRDTIADVFFTGSVSSSTSVFVEKTTELVSTVLLEILQKKGGLKGYPKLIATLKDETDEVLRKAQAKASELTAAMIGAEKCQIFTKNSDYVKFVTEARKAMRGEVRQILLQGMQNSSSPFTSSSSSAFGGQSSFGTSPSSSSRTNTALPAFMELDDGGPLRTIKSFVRRRVGVQWDMEEETITDLQISLFCYREILMRRLFDVIPMLAYCCLIHEVREEYHHHMQETIDDDLLEELLAEDPKHWRYRESLETRLVTMKEALVKLNRLR